MVVPFITCHISLCCDISVSEPFLIIGVFNDAMEVDVWKLRTGKNPSSAQTLELAAFTHFY